MFSKGTVIRGFDPQPFLFSLCLAVLGVVCTRNACWKSWFFQVICLSQIVGPSLVWFIFLAKCIGMSQNVSFKRLFRQLFKQNVKLWKNTTPLHHVLDHWAPPAMGCRWPSRHKSQLRKPSEAIAKTSLGTRGVWGYWLLSSEKPQGTVFVQLRSGSKGKRLGRRGYQLLLLPSSCHAYWLSGFTRNPFQTSQIELQSGCESKLWRTPVLAFLNAH